MAIHSNIAHRRLHQFQMYQPVVIQRNVDQTPNAENKTEFWLAYAREATMEIHWLDADQNVLWIQIVHWIERVLNRNVSTLAIEPVAEVHCVKL